MFEYNRSSVSMHVMDRASQICCHSKVLENMPLEYLQPPYCNHLFPEGRIIVDWVPFRLSSTNIPLLKGRKTVFYSDVTICRAEKVDALNENQTAETYQVQGLLSASSIFRVQHDLDISCNLDIFGTDFRSIYEHIMFHLGRINDFGMERVNLRIFTTKGIREGYLMHSALEQIGMKTITKESRKELYIEQVVYEKKFSK